MKLQAIGAIFLSAALMLFAVANSNAAQADGIVSQDSVSLSHHGGWGHGPCGPRGPRGGCGW